MDDFAPTFKLVDGKLRLPTSEYNRLVAEHGSTWNWCQVFGLRLVRATQNDDGTLTVEVTEEQRSADPVRQDAPTGTSDEAPTGTGDVREESPTGDLAPAALAPLEPEASDG